MFGALGVVSTVAGEVPKVVYNRPTAALYSGVLCGLSVIPYSPSRVCPVKRNVAPGPYRSADAYRVGRCLVPGRATVSSTKSTKVVAKTNTSRLAGGLPVIGHDARWCFQNAIAYLSPHPVRPQKRRRRELRQTWATQNNFLPPPPALSSGGLTSRTSKSTPWPDARTASCPTVISPGNQAIEMVFRASQQTLGGGPTRPTRLTGCQPWAANICARTWSLCW